MRVNRIFCSGGALLAAGLLAACGSSGTSSSSPAASSPVPSTAAPATKTSGSSGSGTGVLAADARSAATGDIPDNQIFLTFANHHAGYSMKYPEGWTQSGSAATVTFRDKNNLVRVIVGSGPAATPASVARQLAELKSSNPSLAYQPPTRMMISGASVVKAVYTTQSAPNPVTGKRVLLIVDRYVLAHSGKLATVDLGTAKGVDNVDAYRKMIENFTWR